MHQLITFAGHLGNADLKSGREVTPGHVSSFGVPMTLNREKDKYQYKPLKCINTSKNQQKQLLQNMIFKKCKWNIYRLFQQILQTNRQLLII